MLISLSWGWKYGLLSTTVGLGGQTMWFLWLPLNGWAPFVSIILYNFWVVWHGWCAEKKKKGLLRSFYGAEIPFRVFSTIMHLTIFPWVFRFNPSPWAPQMTLTTAPAPFVNFIVFKLLVEGFMVLFLADILLNFKFFQKILQQEKGKTKTGHIISASLLFGLIFWIFSGLAGFLFGKEAKTLADSLILQISAHEFFVRIVFIFTCLLAGLIVAKYVARYKESEERFRRLTENSVYITYRMSLPDGRYEYVSPASKNIFGYTPQEFYDSPILIRNAIHPDWKNYFSLQWKNLLEGEMPPFYEYQIIHKSGEERWLNQRNVLIRDSSGLPVAIEAIVIDVTDRMRFEEEKEGLEQKLRQAQKMEAVGTLADGIAHDFNNILTPILGYGEMIQEELPTGSRQAVKCRK